MSGYADITVPAAYIEGLPIGITFIGGRWAEPELIGLAYDFEQDESVSRLSSSRRSATPCSPASRTRWFGAQGQGQQATQGQRDLVVRFR